MAILYVEDDVLTRETVAGRLRRRGYVVLEAASGEEALELAADNPDVAVALLDLELPGINGLETYRRLMTLRPGLPVVVCSATLSEGSGKLFTSLGVPSSSLLPKPCAFGDLLLALEQTLNGLGTSSDA